MDLLSLLGVLFAITAIIAGQMLEGGSINSLINIPALLIVAGGSIGAVIAETPTKICTKALQMLSWVLFPPEYDKIAIIDKIVLWCTIARKRGLLGLESTIEIEKDPFIKKGLELLVDGVEPGNVRSLLEVHAESYVNKQEQTARVFESMGGYSPTIGIIGAVLGLIHVMDNLSDPSLLGPGIATAFVATIYGVGFANLVFIPISNKLMYHVSRAQISKEMIIEGLVSISKGDDVMYIRNKLQGYEL